MTSGVMHGYSQSLDIIGSRLSHDTSQVRRQRKAAGGWKVQEQPRPVQILHLFAGLPHFRQCNALS
jgi:hypothetical protein